MRGKRFLVGTAVAAGLALFGGAALAQQGEQAPSRQAPEAQEQRSPGNPGWDCPEDGGRGQQETQV